MQALLFDLLVDPLSRAPLTFEAAATDPKGTIRQGILRAPCGKSYPIVKGIPRFVTTEDRDQLQSSESFGFKWHQRASYDSPAFQNTARRWLVKRYGFRDEADMRGYFASRRRILDAGCGSPWVGADISSAIDVACERLGHLPNTHFLQGDILQLPLQDQAFDTIFSEGVLHHTPDTAKAVRALVPLLEPGGEILFYVYRKKAPVREFSDDHVRRAVSGFPPAQAWEMLRPLTKLGQVLAELHTQIDVPEDIPYLAIKAGRYDLQRFLYWHVMKLFWNEELTFEENHHVNFDWYHPRYAHRHTEEEVRGWCAANGLRIQHFDAEESGFTVRAIKIQ